MEEKKKHIEIHIKMDENEQITPSSKISNAKAKCDENTQKEVIENESTGSMRRIPASVHRIS
ncbi:hypothetical protein [Ruminococcus callidus]|uniref:hypothetical protein n=1 Tax=Ruminococcus callidus TaxID=40519 RepID=UPI003FD82555